MVPRREKSSTFPQKPTKTEPALKSTRSTPARLRPGVKLPRAGPGQTWLNFGKKDVDDYMKRHQESQDKETRKSMPERLLSDFIRWVVGTT